MNTAKKLMMMMRGSGAPAFSPLDISGLVMWLDASDSTTLFQDDAGTTPAILADDPVGYVADKSGNGKHAVQAVALKKPLLKLANQNGLNALKFDDSTDFLQSTFGAQIAQPNFTWIVTKWGNGVYIFDGASVTHRQFIYISGGLNMSAGTPLGGAFATGLNWHIYGVVFNGASSELRVDGAGFAAGNAGTNKTDGLTLNAVFDGSLPGGITFAEVIMASGLPSAALIAQVDAYLNAKWSIF